MDLSRISMLQDKKSDELSTKGVVLSPNSSYSHSSRKPMTSSSALQSFLDHIPIESITNSLSSSVFELKPSDCIQDAIRSLYDGNVSGAPIIYHVSSDRGNFVDRDIGFIEFSSLVLWSLEELHKAHAESKSDNRGFLTMLDQISHIGQMTIGELAKLFLWEPFFPVHPSDSLLQVLLLFSKHNKLKVVPVVESSNSHVVGFITQCAVLQLLLQSSGLEWFDQIADRPISEFEFEKNGTVVYIFGDQTAADAFHVLWEKRIDVVPVIERMTKTLIGNVRSSDIYLLLEDDGLYHNRKIYVQDMNALIHCFQPKTLWNSPIGSKLLTRSLRVEDFIKSCSRTRQDSASSNNNENSTLMSSDPLLLKNTKLLPPMDTPRICRPFDSLKQLMQDLVGSRSECCFLVTESGQLQSMITLRDIMSKFSPPSMDATIDGGGFFHSALNQSGCYVEHGNMVRDKH